MLLGLLWTPGGGYTSGIWLLLAISLLALGAFTLAQRHAAPA